LLNDNFPAAQNFTDFTEKNNPEDFFSNARSVIARAFDNEFSEKREELLKIQQEEKERQERIAKYKDLLKQEGITVDELAEILDAEVPRKKREARPAKYQYVDENGVTKTWTGQGRTPKAIQTKLDKGQSLSDFEI